MPIASVTVPPVSRLRIAVVGDPHCGKSVFLSALERLLPRDRCFLFRACPDGEGTWTYANGDQSALRRKGSFTPAFVSRCQRVLTRSDLAPCILVDVGGRMSDENRDILSCCTHFVTLCRDAASQERWGSFCRSCGCLPLADVLSDYQSPCDDLASMSVHHLERGEDCTGRPVIVAVAQTINNMISKIDSTEVQDAVRTVRIPELAEAIGKQPQERVLPDGRHVTSISWEGADLKAVSALLHNSGNAAGEVVRLDGAAPGWLVAAVVHELHPSSVAVNSPDGYVPVCPTEVSDVPAGVNLGWSVDFHDGVAVVTVQQKDPSVPLDPADLSTWAPPAVDMGDVVILNGRMPNWGMASLAMTYHGRCRAVAVNQPGVGATVCWTHSAKVALGSVIDPARGLAVEDVKEERKEDKPQVRPKGGMRL